MPYAFQLESLTRELDGLKAAAKVGPSTSDPVAIPLSTLPSFTTDHRFYVMGGVITRDEVEAALVVDTLFLGKKLYEGEGQHGVESLGDQWQMGKIASTKNLAEVGHGSAECDAMNIAQPFPASPSIPYDLAVVLL